MKGSVLVLALAVVLTIGLTQAANGDAQYFYTVTFLPPSTIKYEVTGIPSGTAILPVDGASSGCVAISVNPTDLTPDINGNGSAQAVITPSCNPGGGAGNVTIKIYDPSHAILKDSTVLFFNVSWAGSVATLTLTDRTDWYNAGFMTSRVPATGTIGLIVLLCLIGGAGFWFVRRRRAAVA